MLSERLLPREKSGYLSKGPPLFNMNAYVCVHVCKDRRSHTLLLELRVKADSERALKMRTRTVKHSPFKWAQPEITK